LFTAFYFSHFFAGPTTNYTAHWPSSWWPLLARGFCLVKTWPRELHDGEDDAIGMADGWSTAFVYFLLFFSFFLFFFVHRFLCWQFILTFVNARWPCHVTKWRWRAINFYIVD